MATFAEHMGVNVIRVDAEERFLDGADAARRDPEHKRKIIGRLFVEVFDEEAAKLRGREVARAGHDLSGRDRVGRRARPARRTSSSRITTSAACPRR